jgi:hypothetical protein
MSQLIEVTVTPEGVTRLETKGFSGDTCREASKLLEASLGIRTSEQLTHEFYATTPTEVQQPQSQ